MMKHFIIGIFITIGIVVAHQSPLHATSGSYAALGDSVAAGAGLASSDTVCARSSQAYPYIIAQKTGLSLQHLACSGAKADEGIYRSQKLTADMPAQLDQAFSNGKPSLITLTIGANDARWTQFIRQCYYIRCGYKVDTARFAVYLIDLKLELNIIMAKISTLSKGTPPQVIITGYYNPFSQTSCADTKGLTSSEITWLQNRTRSLNAAISGIANKYSYASYAPISFSGHELCSSEPWVQGISDSAPFHPTASGEEAIARAVFKKYKTPTQSVSPPISNREKIIDWYTRHKK